MEKKYNMRSPAVKRLMREAIELKDPTPMYSAQPLDDNLFEWHFTILGPRGTVYEGGVYHGRILLPSEYPMKPPSIILLTPNGRFELHQKICLSASSYHPELWQPSWSIRTVLLAMIGFMPTEGVGAIGSLDLPPEERTRLAKRSLDWMCPVCGVVNKDALSPIQDEDTSSQDATMAEAANIVTQMAFKSEYEVKAQKQRIALSGQPSKEESSPQPSTQEEANDSTRLRQKIVSGSQPSAAVPTPPLNLQRGQSGSTLAPPSNCPLFSNRPVPHPTSRRSKGHGSLYLIWFLLTAIILLVLRRFYVQF